MSHPHSRTGLYDEIDRLQAGLTTMIKRFHEVVADRDEWKQQHENLLEVHRSDLAALAAKLKSSVPTEARRIQAEEAAYNLCQLTATSNSMLSRAHLIECAEKRLRELDPGNALVSPLAPIQEKPCVCPDKAQCEEAGECLKAMGVFK